MKTKTIIKTIFILSILILFNIVAICCLNVYASTCRNSYDIQVLGAVFNVPNNPGEVNVSLVRPPRQVVDPGKTYNQDMVIKNTFTSPIYIRCNYDIDVYDENKNIVDDFNTNVKININDDWYYNDGYLYYKSLVDSGESINGPIESIWYSLEFKHNLDYNVKIPLLIESVEADGRVISEINNWPNKDLSVVKNESNGETVTWETKIKLS